jgi:hypothetical protein
MKTIKKYMTCYNKSSLLLFRTEAIKLALETNKNIFPNIIEYNDTYYEYEYIEGKNLDEYLLETGDYDFARQVVNTLINFLFELGKHRITFNGQEYILCADDIHDNNIIVDPQNNFYLVDLDQLCWVHKFVYFKILQDSVIRICDSIRYILIDNNRKVLDNKYRQQIKILNSKLEELQN